VADSAICIGIGLLFLDMWRKPEEKRAAAAEPAS
ncbi:MAG: signal peptidase II, partial [Thermoanaerobaculia bacterium]|nr:signal peptidase II [Thermoanaerobaculia bacterium]